MPHYTDISKFLSFALRHEPEAVGIALDADGWAEISAVIYAAVRSSKQLNGALLQVIVDTNDKKRFSISEDGLRIRAVQGHSTKSVDLGYVPKESPEFLYHGTATRFMESILKEGLVAKSRQYVHLSSDKQTARTVGERHGKPVVLKIKALLMHEQGFNFFQAENGVWLVPNVPVVFVLREDN